MKFTCTSCQNPIEINDAKVPSGAFKIKCPKCHKVITLQGVAAASAPQAAPAAAEPAVAEEHEQEEQAISPEIEAFIKREIATAKREILGAMQSLFGSGFKFQSDESGGVAGPADLGRKALVCEDDQVFVDMISTVVKRLGYAVDVARSTAEAIKKVEQNFYELITVDYVFPDDKEGGHKIIARINGQKTVQRRQQFVVLISANVKSADANAAFLHGANITVNKDGIKNLEALIRDGQRNFQQIYNIFSRVLADKNERV